MDGGEFGGGRRGGVGGRRGRRGGGGGMDWRELTKTMTICFCGMKSKKSCRLLFDRKEDGVGGGKWR